MFDLKIGESLRQAEFPVPTGAWDAIRAQIAPPAAPPSLGLGAAATGATILLGSLVVYSAMVRNADAVQSQREIHITAEEMHKEAEAPSELPIAKDNVAAWNTYDTEPSAGEAVVSLIPENTAGQATDPDDVYAEALADVDHQNEDMRNSANELTLTPKIAAQLPETLPPALNVQPYQIASHATPESGQAIEPESLKASIKATNLSGYAPFEIDFKALGNYDQVDWDFGPFGKSQQAHVTRTFDKPGYYTVMLTAYSDNQREMITDMVTIEIHEGSNLVVPDSFTPNGDGINDSFKAEGVNIESFALMVVNASGKVVFETNNINEPWVYNGGQLTTMEAYFAVIKARGVDGKDYSIRQRINIIH